MYIFKYGSDNKGIGRAKHEEPLSKPLVYGKKLLYLFESREGGFPKLNSFDITSRQWELWSSCALDSSLIEDQNTWIESGTGVAQNRMVTTFAKWGPEFFISLSLKIDGEKLKSGERLNILHLYKDPGLLGFVGSTLLGGSDHHNIGIFWIMRKDNDLVIEYKCRIGDSTKLATLNQEINFFKDDFKRVEVEMKLISPKRYLLGLRTYSSSCRRHSEMEMPINEEVTTYQNIQLYSSNGWDTSVTKYGQLRDVLVKHLVDPSDTSLAVYRKMAYGIVPNFYGATALIGVDRNGSILSYKLPKDVENTEGASVTANFYQGNQAEEINTDPSHLQVVEDNILLLVGNLLLNLDFNSRTNANVVLN